jgi:hypothetical protein
MSIGARGKFWPSPGWVFRPSALKDSCRPLASILVRPISEAGHYSQLNLTQIKVALASVCFAVIARSSIEKPRAGPPNRT